MLRKPPIFGSKHRVFLQCLLAGRKQIRFGGPEFVDRESERLNIEDGQVGYGSEFLSAQTLDDNLLT